MNTRLVNTAAGVILAALTQDRTAAGIALALDSAQLLTSPETAAEMKRLGDRVIELEQLLAEKDRPADEDPIAFVLTGKTEDDVRPQVRKLRSLLAGQREQVGGES